MMNNTTEKQFKIIKDIIEFINTKGKVSDKEIINLKKNYEEREFLTSFNHLVENGYIETKRTHNEVHELRGESEQYSLTKLGTKLLA